MAATPAIAGAGAKPFPKGFLWGAATAGHQVEGNNVNADLWLLENVQPTTYAQPSGDANNSFELWPQDLDLARQMGLNSYRFSLEWSRIEPEPGRFSIAMLDHYKRIIDGCRARGLTPIVTFNHFTTPRWFASQGGWTDPGSPDHFARFCERAARHLAANIGYATTLNEPNLPRVLRLKAPSGRAERQRQMLAAAATLAGTAKYVAGNAVNPEDIEVFSSNLLLGHKAGRAAIKGVRPDLPVGVSLAMIDDQAAPGGEARRDAVRADLYGAWLDAARGDDFVGVQNYERVVWGPNGKLPPPAGAEINGFRGEVYAASLAGAVRYAHQASGAPVLVTEHGVVTKDDAIRARFIPAALRELQHAIESGVPVSGYVHWSLVDNFEWSLGYWPTFGLAAVDRTTFKRTAKPSAGVLGAIARRNAI
ncbi:family 1 glycosylhydrolase [Phenylobacterium sp. LjRoot225]|uniref:family 1 glycosylhydrolase n=1 Tax=Phenylobacterium sp. LjRoot225 TaxID=3342285 RepID=UPI003ECEAC8E